MNILVSSSPFFLMLFFRFWIHLKSNFELVYCILAWRGSTWCSFVWPLIISETIIYNLDFSVYCKYMKLSFKSSNRCCRLNKVPVITVWTIYLSVPNNSFTKCFDFYQRALACCLTNDISLQVINNKWNDWVKVI